MANLGGRMASAVFLYTLPGFRQFALLALLKIFNQHGEQEAWQALKDFNREWDDE